jgi:YVTN family beta-propeller protein
MRLFVASGNRILKPRNWRSVRAICGLLLALALMALWIGQSRAQRTDLPPVRLLSDHQPGTDDPSFVPGVVLVQLSVSTARSADAAQRLGVADEALSPLFISGQSALYRLAVPSGEEESSAARLASRSDVLFAEPDYLYYVTETIPNDPLYSRYQWSLPHIRANLGWDRTIGSTQVVIGVVDTGVDLDHPEFAGKIVGGIDTVNNDFDAQDDRGHGTHVASIAAALGDNHTGISGVNWNARIMPIKVLNSAGSGSSSQVAAGITWAADNGADILNMSLSGSNSSSIVGNAIQYAYERGVLLIAAAGNSYTEGNQTSYPAAYDHVIGVAAVNDTDGHASYSNSGTYVDVAAPGGDPSGPTDEDSRHWIAGAYWRGAGFSYALLSGTSQAAPQVAGLAGLLLALDSSLTPDQLTQIITRSAVDVQSPGRDLFSGYGRIDIAAALNEVAPTGQPDLVVINQLVQVSSDVPGVVAAGREATYSIGITNTGTTALRLVPLENIYDSTYMTFIRSNPAPDKVSTDNLQWSNLTASGTLSPGSALTVTVTFQTRATTDSIPDRQTSNLAKVSKARDELGQLPSVQTATAQVRVARSAVLVDNKIASPDLTAVGAGVDITFDIRVENVGEVSLAHVPVYNLYDADVLQFLNTNISRPRSTLTDKEGELFWDDITGDFGDLLPGEVVQFMVTFRMVASRSTINLAQVRQVVDANGDAVPPIQGAGSVEVIPVAPPVYQVYMPNISGYVAAEIEEMPCPLPGCAVSGLDRPNSMAVHTGLNRLYINSRDTDQLIVLDARTLAPITTVSTGAQPWDVVVNENESVDEVYVSNFASGDVWVYDAETLDLKQQIDVGEQPGMMEIFPEINTVAVVVRQRDSVAIIRNGTVVQHVGSGGKGPFGLAADQGNKQLVVTNRDTGNAWIIYKDGDSWRRSESSEMKDYGNVQRTQPFEAAYNPDNNCIYIVYMRPDGQWFVDVIQKNTLHDLRTIATLAVGSSGSDRGPDVGGAGLFINPVTNNLFVADTADQTLTVIGPNNRVVATIPTGEEPFDVVVNPVTNQVFVSLRRDNRIHKFADIY